MTPSPGKLDVQAESIAASATTDGPAEPTNIAPFAAPLPQTFENIATARRNLSSVANVTQKRYQHEIFEVSQIVYLAAFRRHTAFKLNQLPGMASGR